MLLTRTSSLLSCVCVALMYLCVSIAAVRMPSLKPVNLADIPRESRSREGSKSRVSKGRTSSVDKWPKEDMTQLQRGLSFWNRVIGIYASYKSCQLQNFVTRKSKAESKQAMEALHEVNSDRLLGLCLSLTGFYIKTGQFLGTRYDFMPRVYCEKLATLSDSVPPMPQEICRRIIEEELDGETIEGTFSELDLDEVLGAASIAQVHKGEWKATGEPVAVKLQYPGAEVRMRNDLANIRVLAEFLQKTDLKFDVLSAIKELQSQIKYEFDFKREAGNMDFAREGLKRIGVKVDIPKSKLATDRMLVMSYVDGTNLSKLKEMKVGPIPLSIRQKRGAQIFNKLATIYGAMFFHLSKMHADPNPGNISLKGKGASVGLLDWGQVKDVSESLKRRVSNLMLAFNARDQQLICESLFALGVKVTKPDDLETVEAIAVTMLDTREMEGFPCNPFDERCASLANPITLMPAEIYFVVRSVQMLRGLSSAFQLSDFSIAQQWGPMAEKYADKRVIARTKTKMRKRRKGKEV